ncbi:hypothetical protein [Streptococcus dentiloxodontae]
MSKREEWLIDFQVRNGRKPNVQEITAAEENGYDFDLSDLSAKSGWMSKIGLGGIRFGWFMLLEIFLLLLIAILGYMVGYLFL